MGMRKKPYTCDEFFEEICKHIELPDILDYYQGRSWEETEIKNVEWDFNTSINFGSNEGIYLDVEMMERAYDEHGKWRPKFTHLGTFKTLRTSKEAMIEMGKLAGEFVFEGHKFIEDHMDDFTWTGYGVHKRDKLGWWCPTIENAKKRYDELSKDGDEVVVFDWSTRKEIKL